MKHDFVIRYWPECRNPYVVLECMDDRSPDDPTAEYRLLTHRDTKQEAFDWIKEHIFESFDPTEADLRGKPIGG